MHRKQHPAARRLQAVFAALLGLAILAVPVTLGSAQGVGRAGAGEVAATTVVTGHRPALADDICGNFSTRFRTFSGYQWATECGARRGHGVPGSHSAHTLAAASTAGAANSGGWINQCHHSHFNHDDPIVFPGQPAATHEHDMLGNNTTAYDSTYASMTGALSPWNSACHQNSQDTAAYWDPAVLVSGTPQTCTSTTSATPRCTIYYRADNVSAAYAAAHPVEPWPAGFKMIAGNSHATSPAENPKLGKELYYGCSDNSVPSGSSSKPVAPVNCPTGYGTFHVGFPNCWNGVDATTSTGGYNSVANTLRYPSSGVCPAGFPRLLPRLIIREEFRQPDPSQVTLSSGATFTLHGDFWDTWPQAALAALTQRCLDTGTDCGNDPTP